MALLLMFALGAFVRRTRLGKAMRSTAQDRTAALLCGININRTISATFFIGSALAAAAGGVIYSINYGDLKWNIGFHLGIIAFTAAVLGGIGNIVGAGVGGFLIGIIYVFGGSLLRRRVERGADLRGPRADPHVPAGRSLRGRGDHPCVTS